MKNKRAKAANSDSILNYFIKFQSVVEKYNISAHRIFNIDEKEFMKSVTKGSKIIVPEKHKKTKFTTHDGSRESMTMVECICMDGSVLPPMVIFSGKTHLL